MEKVMAIIKKLITILQNKTFQKNSSLKKNKNGNYNIVFKKNKTRMKFLKK